MKVQSERAISPCALARRLAIMLAGVALAAVLSGCAVAMLSGASRSSGGSYGSAGGSTSSEHADPLAIRRQRRRIEAISTAVRSRFGANAALRTLNLTVDTQDGVVTLRGQVNNVDLRNAAQLEARAVQGVEVGEERADGALTLQNQRSADGRRRTYQVGARVEPVRPTDAACGPDRNATLPSSLFIEPFLPSDSDLPPTCLRLCCPSEQGKKTREGQPACARVGLSRRVRCWHSACSRSGNLCFCR